MECWLIAVTEILFFQISNITEHLINLFLYFCNENFTAMVSSHLVEMSLGAVEQYSGRSKLLFQRNKAVLEVELPTTCPGWFGLDNSVLGVGESVLCSLCRTFLSTTDSPNASKSTPYAQHRQHLRILTKDPWVGLGGMEAGVEG